MAAIVCKQGDKIQMIKKHPNGLDLIYNAPVDTVCHMCTQYRGGKHKLGWCNATWMKVYPNWIACIEFMRPKRR